MQIILCGTVLCLKNNYTYFLSCYFVFQTSLSGKSFNFVVLVNLPALLSGEMKETMSVVVPG